MLRGALIKIKNTSHKAYFYSPLYRLTLMGKTPSHLKMTPSDTWSADSEKAFAFLKGFIVSNTERIRIEELWDADLPDNSTMDFYHGFEWIKELKSVSDHYTRRIARTLTGQWIDRNTSWKNRPWSYLTTAKRISNWLECYDFFCASADDSFRSSFFKSLARQYRHLKANWMKANSLDRVTIIKAMLMVQICVTGYQHQKTIKNLIRQLYQCICQLLLDDGGIQSGNPLALFNLLKDFIDIRNLLRQSQQEVNDTLHQAIDKVATAVRFLRNGSGELSSFGHLPNPYVIRRFFPSSPMIDQALSFTESRSRPPISLRSTGYERLQEKGSLILLDTRIRLNQPGKFADNPVQKPGLSLFRFEWSWGKHKIIELADLNIHSLESPETLARSYYQHFTRIFRDPSAPQMTCQFRDPQLKMPFCYDRVIQMGTDTNPLIGQETIMVNEPTIVCFRFVLHPHVTCERFKGTYRLSSPDIGRLYLVTQGHDEMFLHTGSDDKQDKNYKTLLFFLDLAPYQPRLFHWKIIAD